MHRAPHRHPTGLPWVVALLLAVLGAFAPGGPPTGSPAAVPTGVHVVAAGQGTAPHADDRCAGGVCLAPAATRHHPPGDHPGHPAVRPAAPAVAPPAPARAGGRLAARPPVPGDLLPHRGRSPPSGV
ncbi:hypothetical protein [Streptomyces sp. NPDC002644]